MKEITIGDLITAGIAYEDRKRNVPVDSHKKNLQALIDNVLQPIFNQFPTAKIICGYRGFSIDNLYRTTVMSDHRRGKAATIWWRGDNLDIEQSVFEMYKWIVENLQFNTMDIYDTYIDISYDEKYKCKIVSNLSLIHNKHIATGEILD